MNISGIYQIQSKVKPKRVYIGSAVNMKKRWWTHIHSLKFNNHHSIKLQRHFNKYGIDDLVFIIIEPCFSEFLTIREQYYMNKLKPYFNCALTAGSVLGIKKSEECKAKMRRPMKEETKQKIREARMRQENPRPKGSKQSEETKQKLRLINLGKKVSEETKLKMSKSQKNRRIINLKIA
jgi:group I intron endonuclease